MESKQEILVRIWRKEFEKRLNRGCTEIEAFVFTLKDYIKNCELKESIGN